MHPIIHTSTSTHYFCRSKCLWTPFSCTQIRSVYCMTLRRTLPTIIAIYIHMYVIVALQFMYVHQEHALAETERNYRAITNSGFLTKFSTDVVRGCLVFTKPKSLIDFWFFFGFSIGATVCRQRKLRGCVLVPVRIYKYHCE